MGSLAAQAYGAGVVVPAQAEVIHPPDLGFGCDCDIDSNRVKVLELIIEGNPGKGAVGESRTGWDSNALRNHCSGVAAIAIISETSEIEVTVRAPGVAAEGCTKHIEAETASEAVIAIADVT
jgi:hypothetical protein